MTATTTTIAGIYKTLYPAEQIKKALYTNNPFLGMVKKFTKFGGDSMKEPIQFGAQQGNSITFTNAQTNVSGNQYAAFTLTRNVRYSIGRITREAYLSTMGNDMAFVQAFKAEMDGSLYSITRSLARDLYGNGGASLGQASAVGSNVITLANPNDVVNFEIGMVIAAATSDGTAASPTIRSGTGVVSAISAGRTVSTVTYTGTITSVGNTDYFFRDGDISTAMSAGGGGAIRGLAAWIPPADPGATAFFGVARNAHTTRLGGLRIDATALTVEEALQEACTYALREGARITHFFMHPTKMNALALSINSRTVFQTEAKAVDANVGYRGIRIVTSMGDVECFADPNCPSDRIYGLQLDTWTLRSLGDCPTLVDEDKFELLRVNNADSFEWRWAYYAQLSCRFPGANVVLLVSAT